MILIVIGYVILFSLGRLVSLQPFMLYLKLLCYEYASYLAFTFDVVFVRTQGSMTFIDYVSIISLLFLVCFTTAIVLLTTGFIKILVMLRSHLL